MKKIPALSSAHQQGYTLVELLVALAVTSIVIAGTYAAYTFFAQQKQVLFAQSDIERVAMRTMSMMQADIQMAGYKDYYDINPLNASQAIIISSASPGDITLQFDDYDGLGTLYRSLIRYYTQTYTSATGIQRLRLYRDWRKCTNPASGCDLASSVSMTSSTNGDPLMDWVTSFLVSGADAKASGTFAGQFQTIQVTISTTSPQIIEGTSKQISRKFVFLTRVKNVSLVP